MDTLCSVDVAAVRAEPREDAERVTELLRGEPTEREGFDGVVEEPEPPDLGARRRRLIGIELAKPN